MRSIMGNITRSLTHSFNSQHRVQEKLKGEIVKHVA